MENRVVGFTQNFSMHILLGIENGRRIYSNQNIEAEMLGYFVAGKM